jgi:leader peptidase (prepilin peptidase)/N-methyltransferase
MFVPVLVFLLGLCIGSFVNVLVFRLPESESVVSPGSRCRACDRPLAWYENIPLLSYLALGGRCRACRAPISFQYPLVELAVALLFVGNFLWFGGTAAGDRAGLAMLARPGWIIGAVFTTILLAIALTDLRTYLIPDELSVGGMLLGLALSLLPGGLGPLQAFLGAFAGGALLLAVAWLGSAVFRKEAMGGGDIKMLAMIGAFVGWQGIFLTLFLGALLGSVVYGPIVLVQRRRRPLAAGAPADLATGAGSAPLAAESSGSPEDVDRGLVPFGFFLAPAAALTFYLAEDLVRGYLRLVGLSS